MNRIRTFLVVFMLAFLSSRVVNAETEIKVAVVPSILNMFIQYGVVGGLFTDDPNFFEKTYQEVTTVITANSSLKLSSYNFGTDSEAVNKFMMSQPYPSSRERYDADILVMIGNSDDGKSMEVFIVAVESGRAVSYFADRTQINNETLASTIIDRMQKGLAQARELIKVNADKIHDTEESVAEFVVVTKNNKELAVRFDYDTSHQELEAVQMQPVEVVLDGWHDYVLVSEEGLEMTMALAVKNSEVVDMRVEIDYKPEAENADGWKSFSFKSKAGYPVVFTFYWSGGEKEKVRIEPAQNPFLPHMLSGQ